MAENYLQHAEHYFRIMAAQQAQMQQYQQQQQQAQANGNGQQPRTNSGPGDQPYLQQPAQGASAPSFSLNEAGMAEDDEEGQEAGAE
jgi:hypothetical protein